jgi:parallel beta-helix repeat protein
MVFSGNVSYLCEHGIRVARFGATVDPQQYITITNNVVNQCQFGISIEEMGAAGYYTIVGNTVTYATQQGIRITNSENGTVVGNQITASTAEAILFYSSGGSSCGRAAVTGNHIHVCTYGIRQINSGGTALQITVSGNDVTNASVAKAGLLTPGGLGCSPVSKTSSRALGGTYTNTNDFPLFVAVTAGNSNLGGNDTLLAYVNGLLVVGQQGVGYGGGYPPNISVTFMVPPSATYTVYGINGQINTLILWTEYTS